MKIISCTWRAAAWCLAAGLIAHSMPAAADEGPQDPPPKEQTVTVVLQEGGTSEQESDETAVVEYNVEVLKPGKYWLGIVCSDLDNDLVKNQLDIEYGIVITEVVPDSPAAQAGLQAQDILIQVGDQPLKDLKTLVASTEKAQNTELTLTLIRKGKRETVAVTPAERPESSATVTVKPDKVAEEEWKMLQEALRQHGASPHVELKSGDHEEGTKMLFVMPGFVLPGRDGKLPENLEITIAKKGEKPARITVQRGEDKWEVDADSLDQLPEDIRPHVKQMLDGGLSVTFDSKGLQWSGKLPKPLALPEITPDVLKKSFKVAPEMKLRLKGLSERLPDELREKIHVQLKEAQEQLEEVQSGVPAETLEKIRAELKELREQLEKLKAERAKKQADEDDDD